MNEYKIVLEHLIDNKGERVDKQPISFVFTNHDDLYKILEKVEAKNIFTDKAEREQFVIGLKLFGGVMMKNKDMELFSEMQTAFVAFMKKLKSQ